MPDNFKNVQRRLIAKDTTLTEIDLEYLSNGNEETCILADLLCNDTTVVSLGICDSSIGNEGAIALSPLLRYNSTLEDLYLDRNNIGNAGVLALVDGLYHNATLFTLDLSGNNVSIEGVRVLAHTLRSHATLRELNLGKNSIGNEGIKELAESLLHNSALLELWLYDIDIDDEGAISMASTIHHNSTLVDLDLSSNNISDVGAIALSKSLHHNSTLCYLDLDGTRISDGINEEVKSLTGWNEVGALSPKNILELPPPCINRFLILVLILKELPICDKLQWQIVTMLRMKDIVDGGNPRNKLTWTCVDNARYRYVRMCKSFISSILYKVRQIYVNSNMGWLKMNNVLEDRNPRDKSTLTSANNALSTYVQTYKCFLSSVLYRVRQIVVRR